MYFNILLFLYHFNYISCCFHSLHTYSEIQAETRAIHGDQVLTGQVPIGQVPVGQVPVGQVPIGQVPGPSTYLLLLLLGGLDDPGVGLPGLPEVVEESDTVEQEGDVDREEGEVCTVVKEHTDTHTLR